MGKTKAKVEYTRTDIEGGVKRIFDICEMLRGRNTDGYLGGAGFLAKIKGSTVRYTLATTCSPFTGTVLGLAFDPKYPRDDLNGDPYVPRCNGNTADLPFMEFFHEHNGNKPIESIVEYGLGTEIKDLKELRRGDFLAIDWYPLKKHPKTGEMIYSGGHVSFVWDVHLNENKEADAVQILGSHGPAPGFGVHIFGCDRPKWLEGKLATKGEGSGELKLASGKTKIFEDSAEIVAAGWWFGLPKVTSVDPKTFIKTPRIALADSKKFSFGHIRAARLFYQGDAPKPYCMKDGAAGGQPATPAPVGHLPGPVTVVKAKDVHKDPDAPKKVDPKPVQQEKDKPLTWQHRVEAALQAFYHAKWIESDPGDSDNLNDAKSQAAIKEFQRAFKLDDDGVVGPLTWDMIKKQLPAVYVHPLVQVQLELLYLADKLKQDPGPADGTNNGQMKEAVKEFQGANGLTQTGIPDADTVAKLKEVIEGHAPTDTQQGLAPKVEHLYWVGNNAAPGGSPTLRIHARDLILGQECPIVLRDAAGGAEVKATVTLKISGPQSEVAVPLPADFTAGKKVHAKVTAKLADEGELEANTTAPLEVRSTAGGALEPFFTFKGDVGEGKRFRNYTYNAYKVAGKPDAWFIKGRFMTDVDGAPNCYHPDDKDVNTHYLEFDFENHKGALDWLKNGGQDGNWFGVVTDTGEKTGKPIVQGPNDPFPGFYVASTSLVDKSKKGHDPNRYVDARKIPYIAWPYQVWTEGKGGDRFTKQGQGPTGDLGDLLTVVNPKGDAEHRYAHAVFADMGGKDDPHFGEGSPALAKRIHAAGLAEPALLYIIYPRSGAGQGTIPTAEHIHEKGEELFKAWGGLAEAERVLSLMK